VAPDELERRIGSVATREFVYLRRRMTPADAARVMALGIPGVYSRREYQRFYPAGQTAAHVVGFTNVDDRGQEGIELAYDEWLTGVPGSKQVIKDLYGHVIRDVQELSPARPGPCARPQPGPAHPVPGPSRTEKGHRSASAESGCVVVLDARSGEILAMANQPTYNPNNRGGDIGSALRNRAITDLVEPGSTMKPLTMIAALESGKYHPGMTMETSPGYIRVGRKTFRDHHNYGLLTLGGVITKSSQVGTVKIAMSLEPDAIRDVFVRAGLGQSVGTGFPGESVGVLPDYRKWSDVARANLAFGYGLSVTPLQLARTYSILAAGGVEHPLTLLRGRGTPEAKPGLQAGDHRAARGHDEDRDATGRHRAQGRDQGIYGGWQDGHGASHRPRRLRGQPLRVAVRRLRARHRPAHRRGGDRQRSARRCLLRRGHRGSGVLDRRCRRPAADGRAARQPARDPGCRPRRGAHADMSDPRIPVFAERALEDLLPELAGTPQRRSASRRCLPRQPPRERGRCVHRLARGAS
jgi:hypothetical protein